jgi:ABC-2 type transport system ATP-binding protein
MKDIIEVSNLSKKYRNGVLAVDSISFSFDGGILGLVGPNGAGKSTLIKMMVGQILPTKGTITIFGKDVNMHKPPLTGIGILHEKPSFPSYITIREYLEHISKFTGTDERDIREVCNLVEITPYIDRKLGQLSAGMLQKFGIAEAILGYPKLAILDEPTSNLDPLNRSKVLEIVTTLSKELGMNFLISTHILSELERVCDKIMIFNQGKMLTYGKLEDIIIDHFSNRYKVTSHSLMELDIAKISKTYTRMSDDEYVIEYEDEEDMKKMTLKILKEKDVMIEEFIKIRPSLEQIFEKILHEYNKEQ